MSQNDLIDVLFPLFLGTKILGLSPYERTRHGYQTSIGSNLLVLLLCLYHVIGGILVFNRLSFNSIDIIVKVILKGFLYVSYVSTVAIYAIEVTNRRSFIKINTEMVSVDQMLIKHRCTMSYDKARRSVFRVVVVLHIYSIAIVTFCILNNNAVNEEVGFWSKLYNVQLAMLLTVPTILHSSICCIYCVYACLLYQRFKLVNEIVLQRVLIEETLKNKFKGCDLKLNSFPLKVLMDDMKQVHFMLSNIMNKLAEIYSTPLLFALIIAYVAIFVEGYFFGLAVLYGFDNLFNTPNLLHWFSAITFESCTFLGVTLSSEMCTKEAKKTACVLTRIAFLCDKVTVYKKVKAFLLQIKNIPITVRAAGMFDINAKLIATFFGSLLTNIMIFVQFEMTKMPDAK